jgi:GT2 family glycosyltransferase
MGMVDHYPALNRPADPVCSVCIANYNGAALLDDCLASVFRQAGDVSVEVLVHDDASTDDSVTLLHSRYPHADLLVSHDNVGFCVSNNRLVEHARGEFILLLNNDAALFPDALRVLLTTAREQAVPGILSVPQFDWTTGELVDRGCMLDPFLNPVPNMRAECRDVAMVVGACLWIPRALWIEIGGFPEWFGSIGEDLYLCCRARLAGYSVQVTETSGFRHRIGASFGGGKAQDDNRLSTTFKRRALSERNKTFVMAMTYPAPAMQLLLPLHLVLLLVEGALLALLRRQTTYLSSIYLPVFGAVLGKWTRLCVERNKIQKQRTSTFRAFFSVFEAMPYKLKMLLRHGVPEVK